jgi:hypothetical protein
MKYSEFKKLSKEERAKVPYKDQPKEAKVATFSIIGVLAIVLIAIIFSAFSGPTKEQLSDKAYFFAKEFVKENLKSPSSANFPLESAGTWSTADSVFILKSYVDSQNEFGATVRSNYYAKLQYKGGDYTDGKNWKLIEFHFTE